MSAFKVMKVFDCQDMPENLCDAFLKLFSDGQTGNNCFIEWEIGETWYGNIDAVGIDIWLTSNGANTTERVIVKYWW